MNYPYNIGPLNVTVYIDGDAFTVPRSPEMLAALASKDWPAVKLLAAPVAHIAAVVKAALPPENFGDFTLTRSAVKYRGRNLNNASAARIVELAGLGLPVTSELACLASLMKHDDARVIDSFEDFIDRWKIPRLDDGRILLCKAVNGNYTAMHDNKTDWTPGTKPPRLSWDYVERDPNQTCSRGYHAAPLHGAQGYMSGGRRLIEVAVWPEDICAFPTDYTTEGKIRAVYMEALRDIPPHVAEKYYGTRTLTSDNAADFAPEPEDDETEDMEDHARLPQDVTNHPGQIVTSAPARFRPPLKGTPERKAYDKAKAKEKADALKAKEKAMRAAAKAKQKAKVDAAKAKAKALVDKATKPGA